ncbi:potassium channel family protein [Pseudomonas sp. HR96]|uniref:potassium channel family protein n=1 Tax=Pseudomonas sp. HR96 TaxID=1027966 RepID=UPI002A749317|nr:potassium channel family protein [Pseudomonas sp. HR96]WPP00921.1 potassium channel family protein [Pseudomonas sp. HR96]
MLGVTAVNVLVVMCTVVLHYECLLRLNLLLPRLKHWVRFRLVIGVFGAMVAHALEVWCFALAYWLIIAYTNWGSLQGHFDGSLLDCVYFSFTTFTTIGFGDIQPVGPLKFLTGLEALTGLMLITWTASFLFLEMQRYWKAAR